MSNFRAADHEPARTDAEAKRRFLGVLNRSLSTVCREAIWIQVPRPDGGFAAVTNPTVIRLRQRDDRYIYLRSSLKYQYVDDERFDGERKVSTQDYAHTVGESPGLKPQLYSWEWTSAEPRYPHVHVRRGHASHAGLGKLHIPTGRVFFEDVLRFLVDEHEVQPARDDWDEVLGDGARRVGSWATWGARPSSP